ncbi:ABC transporter permease [Aliarcobacter cryaerophilus]|uniref:Transport permease protein n=1 Tax=Aliarcobacter cryaerophilus TaxID=28198 RepID=A0A2S9SQ19_9BACT|nr:ABC transporter permease [Aliarcobacter cryaerophilus]PRM88662.1 ABC transporter [Aliarcobacter cryaerophilus]
MKTTNSNRQNALRALWDYRFFVISSIKTEYKTRFARSKLGFLWMIIQPLSMVLIYSLILSQIMKGKLPGVETQYAYPIYILSGVIGWTLFSEVLNRCLNIFIDNANLLKKLSFPRLTLPVIVVASAIINFILMIVITYAVLGLLGHFPIGAIYYLPILVFITLALAIGLGMFLGIINVFIRDIGQLMGIIMQFWFWLTPIIYMLSIVPEKYHNLFLLNPMTGIILGYQNVILYEKAPDLNLLIYPSIVALVSLCLTLIIYRKAVEEMTDVL